MESAAAYESTWYWIVHHSKEKRLVTRPIRQTREDIEILADALIRNEQWRFDLVLARVAADFGDAGKCVQIVLASNPKEMIDVFRSLLKEAETKRDIPETGPPEGCPW
jgi:hypothetical protein